MKLYANPTVMALLSILCIYLLLVTPRALKKPILILPFILIFCVIYIFLYRATPAPKGLKKKTKGKLKMLLARFS